MSFKLKERRMKLTSVKQYQIEKQFNIQIKQLLIFPFPFGGEITDYIIIQGRALKDDGLYILLLNMKTSYLPRLACANLYFYIIFF